MQNIPDIEVAEFLGTDFLSCEILDAIAQKGDDVEESSELPKYITNYIGSKQKLIDWIWQNTPEDVKSVFDAFGGSNVVGFLYKRKGLKVFTNDQLKYSYHISRAIIENNSVTLSDDEIENLAQPKSNAGDFIQRNFKHTFFTPEVLNILDSLRANIDTLKGYKKDIALFALGKTCISGKGGFGHFSSTTMHGKRRFTKNQFIELYKSNLKRISDLVFDNGQENKAYNGEILDIAPQVKADLAYFDPPYATHFSTTNYETAYHFVEGLMTMWKGKEIKEDSKTKSYQVSSKTVTEKTANEFFENYLNASKHIKYWIISYRDNAYPSERKIKTIIDDLNKDSRMKSRDHHYSLSSAHGENSDAKEHIFICGPRGFLNQAKANAETEEEIIAAKGTKDTETVEEILIEEDFLFALAARRSGYENKHTEDKTRVSGYMGSKYFVLDWIWRAVPKEIRNNPNGKVFFDAFCGGANVAYFFKQKGFKVITNDSLDFPTHIAKAVIENSSVTLTDEDIEILLKENKSAGDFVVKTFHGYYYTKPILEWLDNMYANIQNLKGYKKDLALSAMGATVKAKALFGEFKRSKKGLKTSITENKAKDDRFGRSSLGNLSVKQFEHTFKYYVKKFNSLVFDNGQENKVYKQDTWDLIPKVKADLAYFDPPYVTEFEANDYENAMHFVEGLMTMWKGKEIQDNVFRNYKSTTKYSKKTYPDQFKDLIGLSQKQNKHLLISYRDHAYPTKSEIKSFLKDNYQESSVKEIEVEYRFGKKDSKAGGKYAKELLFVASKPLSSTRSNSQEAERLCHTTLTCDAHLISKAKEGDPQFTFILTHAGTNSNGDHFLASELKTKHETVVEKKIDLKHSQNITDIVGGVISSDYKENNGGVVECVGELYVQDNPHAQLAYKLLKKGIIKQVSMECDYEEGECSICKKRVKARSDDCIHLKKHKGRDYKGKKVYEILHNITFTGLGLLDRAGADEHAKILAVANINKEDSHMSENNNPDQSGNNKQTEKDTGLSALEAKYNDQSEKLKGLQKEADQKDDRIKELESELEKTAKDLEKAQKQIESMEKEKQAAKQKAKAESILKKWESMGRSFETEEEKEKELKRLAGLSEDALGAIEETIGSFDSLKSEKAEIENKKQEEKKQSQANMRAKANVKPESVDDVEVTLKDELKNGFVAAYNSRIGG